MTKRALLVLAVLCVSAMAFAAPSGGCFIPTVNVATGNLNTYTAQLATAPVGQQAPIFIAINQTLARVNSALEAEQGVSTLEMTAEERAEYAQAVADLNVAIRNCRDVALAKNKTLLAKNLKTSVNFLIDVVMTQADEDNALYNELMGRAPTATVVWGTVS